MIAVGTDSASREGAKQVIGPTLMTAGRNRIRAFITAFLWQHGWKVMINHFAADCNKFCKRYDSWTDEPNSETVDAFSVPLWNQSLCICGQVHRETAFIFQPKRMEKAIFRHARSDGVLAVFVVPTAYTADYWVGLRAKSVARLKLTSPETELYNPQGPMENHTIFLVDFSETDSLLPACCGQEHQRRGRQQRLSDVELEERRRTNK
jgi:hypothetical protein